MFQNDACKVLTGKVRLSYCHLTQPRATAPGADAKYSATLLIPKTDTATKAQIDAAMQAVVQEGLPTKWGGAAPPIILYPLYDGDGVRPSGEPFGEECHGHWVLNTSSVQKPQVIDLSGSEVLPTDIYSGMYARVTIRFFAYSNTGKKGIGCGLNNVLKVEEGEPLGGRASAASDFNELLVQGALTPPPVFTSPAGAPGYPTAPAAAPVFTSPAGAPGYPTAPAAAPVYAPPTGAPVYTPGVAQPTYTPPVDPITGAPLI